MLTPEVWLVNPMKIVMFSINPLFPDRITGGAPKHLQSVAQYMGKIGHDVTVLCTRADHEQEAFTWPHNVRVLPILKFHQPFPQPYAIPAYDLASVIHDVTEYLADADRFYMHDGEFLFPFAYQDVPTVVSLRDNIYPETLLGGFLFHGHKLVLISDYSRQYYQHTVGRFFPELNQRTEVIPNGLDWDRFKPTPPDRIYDHLPPLGDGPIVLHPHRPESTKGIIQTIKAADLLVHKYGHINLKVLAPKWLDQQLSPDLAEFYAQVEHEIDSRNLNDSFVFHGWIPQELMPEYYSLGSVTFSLGSFAESFGNAVYESLGCGTLSIAARIATHRELLPDDLLDKVDYDDIEMAAEVADRIIRNGETTSDETQAYLREYYGVERQLRAYAQVIENAEIVEPMQYRRPVFDENTRYQLAPWCYRAKRGVYHDYLANYRDLSSITELLDQVSDGFTMQQAQASGISEQEVNQAFTDGYLVPLFGS